MDRKRKQVERYLRQIKHHRTQEEEKQIARQARQRKATRQSGGPRRREGWDEDEDVQDFEKIRPADKPPTASAARGSSAARVDALGLVIGIGPRFARVRVDAQEGEPSEVMDVGLSPELAATQKSSLAVGDRVGLERREESVWRAVTVLPRRSSLSRPDPSRPDLERVLAANIDIGVLVVSVREPSFRTRLIDRVLVAVQHGGVEPLVCASKIDLCSGEERAELEDRLRPYRALGVFCLPVSSLTGEGVPELHARLQGKTCVFLGQSGVGKSSILNAIEPGLGLKTSTVRDSDGKGRHTTTSSAMFELGNGTRLVDTPGVRSFGLFDMGREELMLYFPDLSACAGGCKFRNCSHVDDPQCAVRQAAKEERVPPERYEVFLRIRASLEQ